MSRAMKRHAFRFKIPTTDGKEQVLVVWCKSKRATGKTQLVLSAKHVRRSIELGGVGNTATCTMAVCGIAQADKFNHPVAGFIDWQYSRAYVVSKVDKNGMPTECVVYEHDDDIAKLNDSKGGQLKLLKKLEAEGDRLIYLRPPQKRVYPPNRPHNGKKTGKNTSRPVSLGHGARLRFAMAQLGGVG